jgi:hypothetical protein
MLDPAQVPTVNPDELLARFILSSGHIRKSSNSVKPDAFIPHPRIELSMTRHRGATIDELWREGDRVAAIRVKELFGRADVQAAAIEAEQLAVVPKPIPENPNHANVIVWPADKPEQKMKATEIARKSQFVAKFH